jgi:hypothetical protein
VSNRAHASSRQDLSNIDVRLQFRRIAQALAAQASMAGGTGHAVTTGLTRETLVKKFLRPHLPQEFDVRSGVIVDAEKRQSRQQDCVLVDTRLPLIDIGSETDAIFVAESVVSTIEIKSYLGSSELADTLASVALTKKLVRTGQQSYKKAGIGITMQTVLPILTYVFAFDGLELNTIVHHVSEFAHAHNDGAIVPEAICVLNKGVVLRSSLMPVVEGKTRNVRLPPTTEIQLSSSPLAKDALFAFYRRFIDDVIPLRIMHYDIDSYYAGDLE